MKGISTGAYGEALESLLGENAKGLSAKTISQLKGKWAEEHLEWNRRDLSDKKYLYWWADGVYSKVRIDDKLDLLVIIGTTEKGVKPAQDTTSLVRGDFLQLNLLTRADLRKPGAHS